MKMRLQFPGRVPYGGIYELKRKDLGIVGLGTSFDMLYDSVVRYRKANALPIGLGLSEEIEQLVCEKYAVECENVDPDLPLKRRLGMDDVVHGTKVLMALKLSGGELVDEQTADRRYSICSRCPLNIFFPVPCSGMCPELRNVVTAIIGHKADKYSSDRRSCAVCGCFSGSHVWLPYNILEKGLDEQMKRSFKVAHEIYGCWKVAENT